MTSQLIGEWSAFAYNGYGSMEDEVLVFLVDGTGWYAFERGSLCERETFTWALDSEQRLHVRGQRYATSDENGALQERPSDMELADLAFTVAPETLPDTGETRPVLRFATPPFAGNRAFALVQNSAGSVFPRFPGETEQHGG